MPSSRLAVIVVLLLSWVGVKVFLREQDDVAWMFIPLVLLLAAIYALSSQINFWWHKRYPPELDATGTRLLEELPFYARLDKTNQKKFRQRVAIFVQNKIFTGMKVDVIPDDIKVLIGASAVALTLDEDDFLLEPFDRIVLYKHAFPSPNHPEPWHNSELEVDDGTLILAIPQLVEGLRNPGKVYNIVMHEWAKAYLHKYPGRRPKTGLDWTKLEKKSGLSKSHVERAIGLEFDDLAPVRMHHDIYYS